MTPKSNAPRRAEQRAPLHKEAGSGRSFQYVHAFLWTFAATMLLMLGLTTTAPWFGRAPVVGVALWEVLTYVGLAVALLRFHGFSRQPLHFLGLRPTHPGLFVLGVLLGVTLQGPAECLRLLVESYSPVAPALLEERRALLTPGPSQHATLIVMVVACLVPLAEELFFRGALFGALRRYNGPLVAAAISGVCFVVGHTNTQVWLPLAAITVALSFLRTLSGSLMPSLALHVAFNTTTVALASLGLHGGPKGSPLTWPWLLASWPAVALLVILTQRLAAQSELARSARIEDLNG